MEYLFTTDQAQFDWAHAIKLNAREDICIISEAMKGMLDQQYIDALSHVDIAHAGLLFFKPETLKPLTVAALNWHFLDPDPSKKAVSWKASLHVMRIKRGLLSRISIDNTYSNPHFVAADIAYQSMKAGAFVQYDPRMIARRSDIAQVEVDRNDVLKFIRRHIGQKALTLVSPLASFTKGGKNDQFIKIKPLSETSLVRNEVVKHIGEYSAIIPTIKRYDYLNKAVYSLLNNVRPPAEIVVVDQTPVHARIEGYYDEFDPKMVKVFFLDKAGQCSSRNFAIQQCKHDWLLLFDDDSEAWPEMITEHIWLLEHSHADASTGISLAPWKDRSFIDKSLDFYHISPVLDTGNSIVHKNAIENINLFDLAFDRGSGADDNLGKRLYRNGSVILFNAKAIRTHHKASQGGLREHGAWWKNKGTVFGPLPLPTESYNFLVFYPHEYYWKLCVYKLITSYRRSSFLQSLVNTILFPLKLYKSYTKAKVLLRAK